MVGDSSADIKTARAAGLPVIAVDFGYSDAPVAELGSGPGDFALRRACGGVRRAAEGLAARRRHHRGLPPSEKIRQASRRSRKSETRQLRHLSSSGVEGSGEVWPRDRRSFHVIQHAWYPWRRSGWRRWHSPSPLQLRRKSSIRRNTMPARIMRTPAAVSPLRPLWRESPIVVHPRPEPVQNAGYGLGDRGGGGGGRCRRNRPGGAVRLRGRRHSRRDRRRSGWRRARHSRRPRLHLRPGYRLRRPFAAPFNAAGAVAGAPFQVVSGAFGGTPAASADLLAPLPAAPMLRHRRARGSWVARLGWTVATISSPAQRGSASADRHATRTRSHPVW